MPPGPVTLSNLDPLKTFSEIVKGLTRQQQTSLLNTLQSASTGGGFSTTTTGVTDPTDPSAIFHQAVVQLTDTGALTGYDPHQIEEGGYATGTLTGGKHRTLTRAINILTNTTQHAAPRDVTRRQAAETTDAATDGATDGSTDGSTVTRVNAAATIANPATGIDFGGGASGSGTPVAQGVGLFQQMFENLLSADAANRATVDQRVSIINALVNLARTSPSAAADFRFFGAGGERTNEFEFVNALARGKVPGIFGTGVSGNIGGHQVTTPGTLRLKQLSFLNQNPNIATVLGDITSRLGDPDLFTRSIGSGIRTGPQIAAGF